MEGVGVVLERRTGVRPSARRLRSRHMFSARAVLPPAASMPYLAPNALCDEWGINHDQGEGSQQVPWQLLWLVEVVPHKCWI